MSTPRMTIVVGAGGVGKTTVAAALAARHADAGERTLVMTFDPSMRLKDTLGVDERAAIAPVQVPIEGGGELWASLLDPKRTFDTLIARYAPDEQAQRRIEAGFHGQPPGQSHGEAVDGLNLEPCGLLSELPAQGLAPGQGLPGGGICADVRLLQGR